MTPELYSIPHDFKTMFFFHLGKFPPKTLSRFWGRTYPSQQRLPRHQCDRGEF